jgi:hypothetical protein
MMDLEVRLDGVAHIFTQEGHRIEAWGAAAERRGRMRKHRLRNRRVAARRTRRGQWRVRLYRDAQPVARGTIFRPGFVTWTLAYNLVELGDIDEAGRYVFLGYDYGVTP